MGVLAFGTLAWGVLVVLLPAAGLNLLDMTDALVDQNWPARLLLHTLGPPAPSGSP